MKQILYLIVCILILPAMCLAEKFQIEGTRFDLTASTVPPPPGICLLSKMSLSLSFEPDGYDDDGYLTVKKGTRGKIAITLRGDGNCTVKGKTVSVYVDDIKCVSVSPESDVSDENGKADFTFKAKNEGQSYIQFDCEDYTLTLYVTVTTNVKINQYEVFIYKKSASLYLKDTWSFSEDGNFTSKKLGLNGTWKDLGNDSFSVKIDPKKVKNSINAAFLKIGLDTEDSNASIKKLKILGVFQNNGIKGNLSLDLKLSIAKPISTSINSKAKLSFTGKIK